MSAPSLRATLVVVAAVALVTLGIGGRRYARGAAFVVEAAGLNGVAHKLAGWELAPVETMGLTVPSRHGALRGCAYQPSPYRGGRGILLVPGVHAAGIDEPRLVGFARDLAGMGYRVLTVELPDLAHYEITSRTTDMIEDAAAWMLHRAEYHGPDGRIGMMGISFGGGLALVAAGRPSIANSVAFGMSLGGHGDLPRTLRYLCTGIQPDGAVRPPHDYGLAIVLLNVADAIVPANQVRPLRDAIFSFLEASRLDVIDKVKAAAEFARAKTLEASLGEPAHTYMGYVNARDVARLGPLLLPTLGAARRRSRAVPVTIPTAAMPGLSAAWHRRQRRTRDRVHVAGAGLPRSRRPSRAAGDTPDHSCRSRSLIDRHRRLAVDTLLDEVAR